MSYFDETEPYWGNTTSLVVGAGNGRLSARSVKIFADGLFLISVTTCSLSYIYL